MLAVDASRWTLDSPLPDEAALRNVAQLRRYNQQQATISIDSAPPLPSRIGIIGAGIMGLAVALTHARRGLPVRLADACPETLARARPAIRKMAASESIKSGSMGMADATADAGDPAWLDRLAEQVTPVSSLEELSDCDLIFETVVEIADSKRELYARLEPHIQADAILASNTSTLSISNLAAGLKHPQRFCGMHFFNPVSMRPLVEVVCGERTSEAILGAVVAHVRRLGKLPLRVADRPGFLVNRLLMPYLNESLELLAAGATIGQIDQAAERFGMPLGPLALYDLIGIDTSFYAGRGMWEAYPERITASPMLRALVRRGRLGRKADAGFYGYETGSGERREDPTVTEVLEPYVRPRGPFPPHVLGQRLLLPVVLEATRLLSELPGYDVRDVDLAMLYGLGFPEQRGGLLFWADRLGAGQILQMLEPFQSLGPRYEPPQRLLAMARAGQTFYAESCPEKQGRES